jgi:hypothetical protein
MNVDKKQAALIAKFSCHNANKQKEVATFFLFQREDFIL